MAPEQSSPQHLRDFIEKLFSPAKLPYSEQLRRRKQNQETKTEADADNNSPSQTQSKSRWHIAKDFSQIHEQTFLPAGYPTIVDATYQASLPEAPHRLRLATILPNSDPPQKTARLFAGIIGGLTAFEIFSHAKNPLEGALIGGAAGILVASMVYNRRERPKRISLA